MLASWQIILTADDAAGDLHLCVRLHIGEGHQVPPTGDCHRDVEAPVQRAAMAVAGVLVHSPHVDWHSALQGKEEGHLAVSSPHVARSVIPVGA